MVAQPVGLIADPAVTDPAVTIGAFGRP